MAKWQAEVLSPWMVDANGQRSIQISRDYAGLTGSDVTGQRAENIVPDPNMMAVVIECEAAVLDAIEKDSNYLVLFAEEIVEGF